MSYEIKSAKSLDQTSRAEEVPCPVEIWHLVPDTPRLPRHPSAEYIEVFYNRIRRHSAIDYVSPERFEEVNRGRAA